MVPVLGVYFDSLSEDDNAGIQDDDEDAMLV